MKKTWKNGIALSAGVLGAVGALGGLVSTYISPITFVGLVIFKIAGIANIPWVAFTEASVIITPIYMFVFGLLLAFVGMIVVGVAAEELK